MNGDRYPTLPRDQVERALNEAQEFWPDWRIKQSVLLDKIEECEASLEETDEQISLDKARRALDLVYVYLGAPDRSDDYWETVSQLIQESNNVLDSLIEGGEQDAISLKAENRILAGIVNLYREPLDEESKQLERKVGVLDDFEMIPILTRATLSDEWAQLGRADRIEATISACREALEILDIVKNGWVVNQRQAVANITLGNAYFDRIRGDRRRNLKQAIKCLGAGLDKERGKDPDRFPQQWALAEQNLGNSYLWSQQYEQAGEHYKKAHRHQEEHQFAKGAATTLNNWGIALACRATLDMDEVRRLEQEEVQSAEKQREHAVQVYKQAEEKIKDARDRFAEFLPAYSAVASFNLGRLYELWRKEKEAIGAYNDIFEKYTQKGAEFEVVELAAARRLGRLHFKKEEWSKAHDWYTRSIQALETVQGEYGTEWGRLILARQNARLFANLAYACCQLAESRSDVASPDEWYSKALVYLENSQARLLTEMLIQHDAVPREAPQELCEKFLSQRERLRMLESELRNHSKDGRPLEEIAKERQDIRKEFFETTVPEIQKTDPDFTVRSVPPLFSDILDSVPTDTPTALIYFDITDHGTYVFVVTRPKAGHADVSIAAPAAQNPRVVLEGALHVFWVDFKRSDLQELLFKAEGEAKKWMETYEDWQEKTQAYEDWREQELQEEEPKELVEPMSAAQNEWDKAKQKMINHIGPIEAGWFVVYQLYRATYQDVGKMEDEWSRTIKQITQDLYRNLFADVDPYLEQTLECKRIIFVPHLALRLLPLHAMQDPRGKYLVQRYETTYIPNAAILGYCRQRLTKRHRKSHFLGVAVWENEAEKDTLEEEIEEIASLFVPGASRDGTERIIKRFGKDAEEDKVIKDIISRNYVVFACHGQFDLVNPGQSALNLSDERLELNDLYAKVSLPNALLVTLGACESGLVDHNNPVSEFTGLPGGFLYVGAPAVISGLWMLEPETTKQLVVKTYTDVRDDKEPLEALCEAQRQLIDQGGTNSHPRYWGPLYFCGGCKGWWK